jgi:primosomal replication protein N
VIKNLSTGVTAGLFSASSSNPTMPSGYTKKRLIGVVRYTPSGIAQFVCIGQGRTRQIEWMGDISNLQALSGGAATSWTDVNLSSYVPPVSTLASLMIINTVIGVQLQVRPNGTSNNAVRQTTVGLNHGASVWLQTDGSQVIEYQNSTTGGSSQIYVLGFLQEL